jgi:prophage regulatory protein
MRVLRRPDVREKVQLSDAQIDRLEAVGKFPSRIRLGTRAIGWLDEDIDAWLRGLAAPSERIA